MRAGACANGCLRACGGFGGSGFGRGRSDRSDRRGREFHSPNVAAEVERFGSGLAFVELELMAPNHAIGSFVLAALQGNRLSGRKRLAQTAESASDGANVKCMGPAPDGRFVVRLIEPDAQWQNHSGTRAALFSSRHEKKLNQLGSANPVTEVMKSSSLQDQRLVFNSSPNEIPRSA